MLSKVSPVSGLGLGLELSRNVSLELTHGKIMDNDSYNIVTTVKEETTIFVR